MPGITKRFGSVSPLIVKGASRGDGSRGSGILSEPVYRAGPLAELRMSFMPLGVLLRRVREGENRRLGPGRSADLELDGKSRAGKPARARNHRDVIQDERQGVAGADVAGQYNINLEERLGHSGQHQQIDVAENFLDIAAGQG